MNIETTFGPPTPPKEHQQTALEDTQRAFLSLARCILENVPNNSERREALEALKTAKALSDAAIHLGYSTFNTDTLGRLFAVIEDRDQLVAQLWINSHDFVVLRQLEPFDLETKRERLRQGIQGYFWNAEVRLSKDVPPGLIALTAEGSETSKAPQGDDLVRF